MNAGLTVGVVGAVMGVVVLAAASKVALLILTALLFPGRVLRARARIEAQPGSYLMRGFVVVAIVGLVSMALANTPGRIFGLALLIALGFFAVVGAAAIVRIAAERILSEGTAMPPFAALTRGAIVCVLAVLVPIFGWFVVLPVGLCISVGGGIAAFVTPTRSRALCPIPGEGQAVDGEVR